MGQRFPYKITLFTSKAIILLFLLNIGFSSTTKAQLVWEITAPNGQSSHLLATQHIKHDISGLDDAKVKAFLEQADSIVMPVLLKADLYSNIYNMFVTDPNHELSSALSKEDYKLLESFLKKEYGLKLGVFKKIKPVFLYIVMAQTGVSTDDRPYIEEYYYKLANDQNITTIGLESFEEQVYSLDTLPLETQIEALAQLLQQFPNADDQDKWVKLYKKGKLKKLNKWQLKKMHPAIYNAWITERNKKLTDKLIPTLQKGNIFVMIPAYQLEGNDGIFNYLRSAGYTIKKGN